MTKEREMINKLRPFLEARHPVIEVLERETRENASQEIRKE